MYWQIRFYITTTGAHTHDFTMKLGLRLPGPVYIPVTALLRLLVYPPAFQDNGRENPLLSLIVSQDSASLAYHWWLLNREPVRKRSVVLIIISKNMKHPAFKIMPNNQTLSGHDLKC